MTNDTMLGGLYLLMAAMLVLGALMARREPAAKMLTMALALTVVTDWAGDPAAVVDYGGRFPRLVPVPNDGVGVELNFPPPNA